MNAHSRALLCGKLLKNHVQSLKSHHLNFELGKNFAISCVVRDEDFLCQYTETQLLSLILIYKLPVKIFENHLEVGITLMS